MARAFISVLRRRSCRVCRCNGQGSTWIRTSGQQHSICQESWDTDPDEEWLDLGAIAPCIQCNEQSCADCNNNYNASCRGARNGFARISMAGEARRGRPLGVALARHPCGRLGRRLLAGSARPCRVIAMARPSPLSWPALRMITRCQPGTPDPAPDHGLTGACPASVATGGIGARSGVESSRLSGPAAAFGRVRRSVCPLTTSTREHRPFTWCVSSS